VTLRGTLVLVRHGETPANLERVWHGSTDTPLSERGRAQAQRVARLLAESQPRPAFIYTSPLQRAAHTAREIGLLLGLEPVIDADLSEYQIGTWEGRSYRELLEREDFWGRIARDPDFAPEGGESVRQVAERFVRSALRIAAAHPGARGVVVSHGGAMALGLGWLLDGRHSSWKRVMRNCAVSELVFDPEPRLARFDDAAHLEDLGGVDPRDLRGEG
jgi:broad specificity phosphatase PhoE